MVLIVFPPRELDPSSEVFWASQSAPLALGFVMVARFVWPRCLGDTRFFFFFSSPESENLTKTFFFLTDYEA